MTPKKGEYTTPAPALDLTTPLRGDFVTTYIMLKKGGGVLRRQVPLTPPPPTDKPEVNGCHGPRQHPDTLKGVFFLKYCCLCFFFTQNVVFLHPYDLKCIS